MRLFDCARESFAPLSQNYTHGLLVVGVRGLRLRVLNNRRIEARRGEVVGRVDQSDRRLLQVGLRDGYAVHPPQRARLQSIAADHLEDLDRRLAVLLEVRRLLAGGDVKQAGVAGVHLGDVKALLLRQPLRDVIVPAVGVVRVLPPAVSKLQHGGTVFRCAAPQIPHTPSPLNPSIIC